jgi:inhibitor of cysteine peptidase
MKKRAILVLSLFLPIIFLLSCVTSRDIQWMISCDTFNENATGVRNDFEIEIGDKIYVELCSNPSTGFQWGYEMSGDTAVKEEEHDYQEPEGDAVGAAGKELWTFEGVSKGTSEIRMTYSQPWDGGIKDEWIYVINVVVK